jgi:hypothetical protein
VSGVAINFISVGTHAHFSQIENLHSLDLPREQIEGFEPVETEAPVSLVAPDGGGIKGHRKSKKDKLREAAARSTSRPPAPLSPPAPPPRNGATPSRQSMNDKASPPRSAWPRLR